MGLWYSGNTRLWHSRVRGPIPRRSTNWGKLLLLISFWGLCLLSKIDGPEAREMARSKDERRRIAFEKAADITRRQDEIYREEDEAFGVERR